MKPWLASAGAVAAGFIVTALASTAADAVMHAAGIFPRAPRLMSDPLFALATAYRGLFTVAGGYITARLAPDRPMRHVRILAGIGLVTGLAGVIAYYIIGGLNSARPATRSRSPSRPSPASGGCPTGARTSILRTRIRDGFVDQAGVLAVINVYDFPHGARGLRVTWLCEEMGLAHTFVSVGFPPDISYRELNPFGTVPFLHRDDVLRRAEIWANRRLAVGGRRALR